MRIAFTPAFLRQMKKLTPTLQEEVFEKTELLKDSKNHKSLKVHKLKGPFIGCYGFSVNYKIRIVFEYISKDEIVFHSIGDHSVYQ